MTRQQETDTRGGDGARAPPLLLDVRELARATTPPASADASASERKRVVAAFGAERVAVLEVTPQRGTRGTASVRIGVFYASDDASAPPRTVAPSSAWAALWTAEEAEAARLAAASSDDAASAFTWALAWSSDGSYLIVSGGVVSRDGAPQVRLWVYTASAWLAISDAASAPSSRRHAPLLIQVDPATYLSPKDTRGSIVAVFCDRSKRHRVFFVTSDAQIVKVDIQLPKLTLLTLEDAASSASSTKTLFSMAVVQRLKNWHASVDAAAFDPASAMLVVTGGIADPSDELVKRCASSFSVWKVREAEPFCELLDSTVVLRNTAPLSGDDLEHESAVSRVSDGLESVPASSSGLLASIGSSLARPLAFMTGRGSSTAPARVLAGSIRQLAVSPQGEYVAMLDDAGRFAVREIATCSDALAWQSVASSALTHERLGSESPVATRATSVLWASSNVLSCVLATGAAVFGSLVAAESLEVEQSDAEADAHALVWRPVETHYRSFPSRRDTDVRVHALATSASAPDAIAGYSLATVGDALVVSAFAAVDVGAFVDALVASRDFDRALAVAEALEASATVDLDQIHRHAWTQFKALATVDWSTPDNDDAADAMLLATDAADASLSFATALQHLRSLQDARWVAHECSVVVAVDSPAHMDAILETGLSAAMALGESAATELDAAKALPQRLQSFRYRLDTLRAMLAAEARERTGDDFDLDAAAEQLYDGAVFRQFRRASVVDVAQALASDARVAALTVLFERHASLLAPRRLALLSHLPATLPPRVYAHLLPAAGPDAAQLYTLVPLTDAVEVDDDDDDDLGGAHARVRVVHVSDATDPDALEAPDAALLDACVRESADVRYGAYARWFHDRAVEIDRVFGQLAVAHELTALATTCLAAWDDATSGAKRAFEAFAQHVERLHTASYVLALPSCAFLSLDAWTALSVHDQMLHVVGDVADWSIDASGEASAVTDAIDRLHAVFVAQRCDALHTLDAALAALCQTLSAMSTAAASPAVALSALALSAHVIHHSNPSMPMAERWIQHDALLLRTAIDVVFAATTEAFDQTPESQAMQHRAMVEHLWRVFQSLPVRKDDDGPEIAALQVEVDAMEDLMVTMDVLSKYGVLRSPKELQLELHDTSGAAAEELLARMCRFALPGDGASSALDEREDTDESAERDAQQWMDVWRDATKLKTHVFGERVSHDALLDAILRHLLTHDSYARAAEHLATNWISSNADAVPHVLTLLLQSIQAKSDALCGHFAGPSDRATYAAVRQCTAVAERVLSTALATPGALDEAFTAAYTQQLSDEHDLVLACQLLDVLTHGAVKRAPRALRSLVDVRDRVDVVLEVLTTNPSHYKVSQRARDWFATHALSHVLAPGRASAASSELAAVLHLATLLRIGDAETPQIVLKGAYAALYCGDYDVAYRLTTDVLATMDATAPVLDGRDGSLAADTDLQHLLSLVLDLVSASSFASWSKKLALCRRVFSAASIDSARLVGHPVAHLVLAAMHKLEATEALAVELGLSEADVEARRQQESSSSLSTTATATTQRISVEELLLNELTLVVELLQEEQAQSDRAFVLRLLQKGFQVVTVSLTSRLTQAADDSSSSSDSGGARAATATVASGDVDRAVRLVQHMSRLCFVEAIASAASADAGRDGAVATDWREYLDLGCRYLIEWTEWQHDDDGRALETFWIDDIAPLLAAESPSTGPAAHAHDLIVRHLHHFFTLQVASALLLDMGDAASGSEAASRTRVLQERRARIEELTSSYDAAKQFVASVDLEPEASPEEGDDDDNDACAPTALASSAALRAPLKQQTHVLVRIAARCQDLLRSHKKTQELEAMSAFFNETLDLERFAHDAVYRERAILTLATTRAHLRIAQQFAAKYGVDPFACVLAYVRAAFVPSDGSAAAAPLRRHEQLELAFERRSGDSSAPDDGDDDVLEQALARPLVFAHFLLNASGDSVYDALDGTDHVGILLLLRMVLECSKRLPSTPDAADASGSDALFPLAKAASDRVTLLFVCLKRLKELAAHHHAVEAIDFKRMCAAERSVAVVTPPASPADARVRAVAAVVPALSAKTIKVVSKILQKLHHVAPSAMVLIYLSHLLATIAQEQHAHAASRDLGADLAAYAYEACTPFLSVLTTDHVLLFHDLFLRGAPATDVVDAFYGQTLTGLTRFHALLSPAKRVAIISDTLRLVQTRLDAQHAASNGADAAALATKPHALERELVQAAVWFGLDCAKQRAQSLVTPPPTLSSANWDTCVRRLQRWFAAAPPDRAAATRDELVELFVPLSELVASVELTALLLELVVLATPPSDAADASVAAMVATLHRRVFAAIVATHLSADGAETAVRRLASGWTTALRLDASGTSSGAHAALAHVGASIDALCGASPVAHKQSERAALSAIVTELESVASSAVRDVVAARKPLLAARAEASDAAGVAAAAVVAEWRHVLATDEQQQQFERSAALARLVLDSAASRAVSAAERPVYECEAFGLQTKAAFAALRHRSGGNDSGVPTEALAFVFAVPTAAVLESFDAVVASALALVSSSPPALASRLTLTLANLLTLYGATAAEASQAPANRVVTWPREQERALAARLRSQFAIPDACAPLVAAEATDDSARSSCWASLLLDGQWPSDRVRLQWYVETAAYHQITSPRTLEAFAMAHWDTARLACVELLLVSPFPKLHAHHCERLVAFAAAAGHGDADDRARLLELLLLRYDLAVLVRAGLYPALVALVTASQSTGDQSARLWTSSGEYLVCALVAAHEVAMASRLACALWHVHPLLFDFENARWTLANFLKALAHSCARRSSCETAALRADAARRALDAVQAALL